MQVHNPDQANTSEEHSTADSARFVPSQKPQKKRRGKRWVLAALVVVVLAAIGGGAYWLTQHNKAASPSQQPAASAQAEANMPAPTASSDNTSLATYTASGSDLNFSFQYPADWTATPPSGTDTTDQPIAISSPLVSLTDASGARVTGKVMVNIRPGSAEATELNADKPTAAFDSTQFAYTAPTPSQHQYPYLTFVHFLTGQNVPGAFEEVIITGIQSFKKGDAVTAVTSDPIVSANFYRCGNNDCTGANATPLSLGSSGWQNGTVAKQVQALFASFKFN